MKFEDFGLSPQLYKAINDLGYVEPTEIQCKTIPLLLEKDIDFVGQAQTGTGKTAAFGLPLIHKIDPQLAHIQAVVLTPTRELARQVSADLKSFACHSKVNVTAIYGGTSYEGQLRDLRRDKPQIIVGTPGRIIDLMKQRVLKFENIRYVVLDEADEMLNMGFLEDVQQILQAMSEKRNLWMFSATMPPPILKLMEKMFHNPQIIQGSKNNVSSENIEQRYYLVKQKYHNEALCRLIESETDMYGIVFCRTRMATRELADELMLRGYRIETLHGEMNQVSRDAAMQRFKKKTSKLMICTDVAARGIDIDRVSHVINFDLPQDLETYIHRIGRTGRAGLKGVAISLVDPRSFSKIKRLEQFTKRQIIRHKLPSTAEMKTKLVSLKLQKLSPLAETVTEKGDDFRLDPTFSMFKSSLEHLSSEELLKLMFTWNLKEPLRRYDLMSDLDENLPEKRSMERERSAPFGRGGKQRFGQTKHANDTRLFLNMGKDDGLQLSVLLSDLSEQTGIQKQLIRNVNMKPKFSFIDIPVRFQHAVLTKKNIKISNRRVRFEVSQPS